MLSSVKNFFSQFCCCNFNQEFDNKPPKLNYFAKAAQPSEENSNQKTILTLKECLQDENLRSNGINIIRSLLNLKALQQHSPNVSSIVISQEAVACIQANCSHELSYSTLHDLLKEPNIIRETARGINKIIVSNELEELMINLAKSEKGSDNYIIFEKIQSDINFEVVREIISKNNSAPYPLTEIREQFKLAVPSENQLCMAPETSPAIIKIRHSLAQLVISKINNNPKFSYNDIKLIFNGLASLAKDPALTSPGNQEGILTATSSKLVNFHDLPANNNELFKQNLINDFIDFKSLLIENIDSNIVPEFHQAENKAAFIQNEILCPVLDTIKKLIDEHTNSPAYLQNGILDLAMKLLQKFDSTFYRIKEKIEVLFSYFENMIKNNPAAIEFEVTNDSYELSLDEESQKEYNLLKKYFIGNYQRLAKLYNEKIINPESPSVQSNSELVKTPFSILKDNIINFLRTIVTNHLAAEKEKLVNRKLINKSDIEISV